MTLNLMIAIELNNNKYAKKMSFVKTGMEEYIIDHDVSNNSC